MLQSSEAAVRAASAVLAFLLLAGSVEAAAGDSIAADSAAAGAHGQVPSTENGRASQKTFKC